MRYSHIALEGDCASVIQGIQDDTAGFAPPFVLFDAIATNKVFF